MLWHIILYGSNMGPGDGWFRPSQSRYGWAWLAERCDADKDGKVTRQEFTGPADFFARLDRSRDGVITSDEFDWSDRSPLAMQSRMSTAWFRMFDANSNGKLSAEEWQALFQRASKGKGYLTADDLRDAFPTAPPRPPAAAAPTAKPQTAGAPSKYLLLKGLLDGEIGSFHEGPRLGDPAPEFTLRTQDRSATIALAQFRGKKPVVLVFGSFT
jgi:hypothetical protein